MQRVTQATQCRRPIATPTSLAGCIFGRVTLLRIFGNGRAITIRQLPSQRSAFTATFRSNIGQKGVNKHVKMSSLTRISLVGEGGRKCRNRLPHLHRFHH